MTQPLHAYISLARLDRPIGVLMLYILPAWWGITLASPNSVNLKFLLLFVVGVTIIRGAGCTFNDWADRDIDRHVTRTKMRPLARGDLSPHQALLFFCGQCLAGLLLLLFYFPMRTWPLSLIQLALFALYPFMKRITYWPQLMLGFAINFGVIFGAVAMAPYEVINWPALLCLYGAGIAWTMGYDTIYAIQDKEEDLKIGVKSTAIRFGAHMKTALGISYGVMFFLLGSVGYLTNAPGLYYGVIILGALATSVLLYHLNINLSSDCQKAFVANHYLGWWVWIGLLLASVL